MAIKKSEIYSSLWDAANALRGSMDSSQYKDYVLVLLFMKYVTDKTKSDPHYIYATPPGGSYDDLITAKNTPHIGETINQIIARFAETHELQGVIDTTDFNDQNKLGKGKDLIDTLSKLISIFESPQLNFANNRADNDDILGDAYEYFMKHFATESGRNKGEFYTPSEVSIVMSRIIGINQSFDTRKSVYDPTCGSGSLLLKVKSEIRNGKIDIHGQEKDNTTTALAKMNMILHGENEAIIVNGNTLSSPYFIDSDNQLKRFDFVVANPPFGIKSWTTGLDPLNDPYNRFQDGIPPNNTGDYAFLLHILASLNSTGHGAVIFNHGVLTRGNSEAIIRENIVKKGYIKGIIGLPSNLFYGTPISACIIVFDKSTASERSHIMFIDASKGFIKDGNKNRLREQDIHKIVDTFTRELDIPHYSRRVPLAEIVSNEYNLNIPRYIDSGEKEDIHNIEGHLYGGIPDEDKSQFESFFRVCPSLETTLFAPLRPGFSRLLVADDQIADTIMSHKEFVTFRDTTLAEFQDWAQYFREKISSLHSDFHVKSVIQDLGDMLLHYFRDNPLIDPYSIFQHFADYCTQVFQDDLYIIETIGFYAKPERIIAIDNKGKSKDKGWECTLLNKSYIIDTFFREQRDIIAELYTQLDDIQSEKTAILEEHSSEDGLLAEVINEKGNIDKKLLTNRIKSLKNDTESREEYELLLQYQDFINQEPILKKSIKEQEAELDTLAFAKYNQLSSDQVQDLLIHHKWLPYMEQKVTEEIDQYSELLSSRLVTLSTRYTHTLSELQDNVHHSETRLLSHLEKLGFTL